MRVLDTHAGMGLRVRMCVRVCMCMLVLCVFFGFATYSACIIQKIMQKLQKLRKSTVVSGTFPSFGFSCHFWVPWGHHLEGARHEPGPVLMLLQCVFNNFENALRAPDALPTRSRRAVDAMSGR